MTPLDRLTAQTKIGHDGAPDITTTHTHDADGRQLSATRSAGTLSLSSTAQYDTAGRVTSRGAGGSVLRFAFIS